MPENENYTVPIDDAMKDNMNRIAKHIQASLPPNWGFALFLFEYGEGGNCTYISSADRDNVIDAMREWITFQERIKAEKN